MGNCFSSPSSPEPTPNRNERANPDRTLDISLQPVPPTSKTNYKGKSKIKPSTGSGSRSGSTTTEMSHLSILRTYATLPNPTSSLPPSILLMTNTNTMAIFDAYPKAKYHFLILPRYPFRPSGDETLESSIVKMDMLDDLKSLLMKSRKEAREEVLLGLANMAGEVEEMVKDEMVKSEGFEWGVEIGFHAIPSMKHLHLHVISDDRISPAFKTKKHHNSFRPDLGFFIPIMEVQRWIQSDDEGYIRERLASLSEAATLLNAPISCTKCDEPFHNMPKLKSHLEKEFELEKKTALDRIQRYGRQGGSDEEIF